MIHSDIGVSGFLQRTCRADLLRGDQMTRFVEGTDRGQNTLFPECPEDWIGMVLGIVLVARRAAST
jgi:hypothetical protein